LCWYLTKAYIDVRRYSLLAKGVERNTYSILRVVGDTLWVLSSKLNKSLLIFNLDRRCNTSNL